MSSLKDAVAKHGSKSAAARYLNIPISTFKDRLLKEEGDPVLAEECNLLKPSSWRRNVDQVM